MDETASPGSTQPRRQPPPSGSERPDLDLNQPLPLGAWLLRRARDHGMTGSQLADLLGLPLHHIRQLTATSDLDDLPLRTVRALTERLNLPWPQWLHSPSAPWRHHHPQHQPPESDTTIDAIACATAGDADRIYAVLVLVLGHRLRTDQIAEVLRWPTTRVENAVPELARRIRSHQGLQVMIHGARTLQLTVSPRTLDHDTRTRLLQLTHHCQGPDPGIALVAFRAGQGDRRQVLELLQSAPELLANAAYITYQIGNDGHPTQIRLTPDVAYSLNIPVDLHDSLLLDR